MPQKPRFSELEILKHAYQIVEENGIESLSARTLATKLDSASSTIFTVFNNMSELVSSLYNYIRDEFEYYLKESEKYFPSFKEFGLRYVEFAYKKPHLYKFIYKSNVTKSNIFDVGDKIVEDIAIQFSISNEDAKELFKQMVIHAHGLAYLLCDEIISYDKQEISHVLSEACIGIIQLYKVKNGDFDINKVRHMIDAIDRSPVLKEELKWKI